MRSKGPRVSPKAESQGLKIGFYFVPFPQCIWRDGIDLSLAAFKLLGYLLFQQRFGRELVVLSDDELLRGHKDRHGERTDQGCGIGGRNNLRSARIELEKLGWLKTSDPDRFGRQYRLVLDREEGSDSDPVASKSDATKPANGGSDSDAGGSVADAGGSDSDPVYKEERESNQRTVENKPCATPVAPAPEKFALTEPEPETEGHDSRHAPLRDAIKNMQRHLGGMEVWDGSAGKHLDLLLKSTPAPLDELIRCLVNRACSPDEPFNDPPRLWLASLTKFAQFPIDRYGKRVRANDAQVGSDQARIVWKNLRDVALGKETESCSGEVSTGLPTDEPRALDAWKAIKGELAARMNTFAFETWMMPTHGHRFDDAVLVVRIPTPEFKVRITKHMLSVREAIAASGLEVADIRLISPEAEAK